MSAYCELTYYTFEMERYVVREGRGAISCKSNLVLVMY